MNFVEANRIHQILGAQNPHELAHIQFRHQNFLITLHDIAQVCRQWIQVAQVQMSHLAPLGALGLYGLRDRAVGGAPRDNQQVTFRVAYRQDVRHILNDCLNLGGADPHHIFVVQRLVVYVAGNVLFFQSADSMFQTRSAGNGPRPRQSVFISLVRLGIPRDWSQTSPGRWESRQGSESAKALHRWQGNRPTE